MTLDNYLNMKGRGSASQLAKYLGVPEALISQWRYGVQKIPADRCVEIESITDGVVKCEECRPDFPWNTTKQIMAKRLGFS